MLTLLDTSKRNNQNDLHGRNGTFLSSVAALAILSITSHHHLSRLHATLVLHHSRPAARIIPAPVYHQLSCREHGTKVTVRDLFGNMPVRLKQRSLEGEDGKQRERLMSILNKQLIGLLLAWGRSVDVSVRDFEGIRRLSIRRKETLSPIEKIARGGPPSFNLPLILTILSQATYINPSNWDKWVVVSARTPSIKIKGAISLEPAPSKTIQFISIGVQSVNAGVCDNVLFDKVNQLFQASSFGAQEDVGKSEKPCMEPDRRRKQDGFTNKQLKGGGKGVDRWPMFFIDINILGIRMSSSTNAADYLSKEGTLATIIKVLAAMITGFLEDNCFQHRHVLSRKRQKLPSSSQLVTRKTSLASVVPEIRKGVGEDLSSGTQNNITSAQPEFCVDTSSGHPSGTPKTRRPFSGSWNAEVKVPNFSDPSARSCVDSFGSWSRIKSGSRHLGQELMSQKSVLQSRLGKPAGAIVESAAIIPPIGQVHGTSELANAGETPGSISHARTATAADDAVDSLETNGIKAASIEDTISWTNPKSKEIVLVNARTGSAMYGTHMRLSPFERQRRPSRMVSNSSHSLDCSLHSCSSSTSLMPSAKSSWIEGFLREWENPVFQQTEEALPRLSFDGHSAEASAILHGHQHRRPNIDIQNALAESSSSLSAKLSKSSLGAAHVISQVERQFLLVCMKAAVPNPALTASSDDVEEDILVLIDQHAADERVRVEGLLEDLCAPPSREGSSSSHYGCDLDCLCSQPSVATLALKKPITFEISFQEQKLFSHEKKYFAMWGILYDLSLAQGPCSVSSRSTHRLSVKTLPEPIAERCQVEPKVLIELLRNELWKREESGQTGKFESDVVNTRSLQVALSSEKNWPSRIHSCPQGILDMINSRSCRSAIMFNDELTMEDCRSLVQRLAKCAFPFQCAHGRPSMIPLVSLASGLGERNEGWTAFGSRRNTATVAQEDTGFSQAWRKWRFRDK